MSNVAMLDRLEVKKKNLKELKTPSTSQYKTY